MSQLPQHVEGAGETGEATFCFVNGAEKCALTAALSKHAAAFNPTFVHINRAEKALSTHCQAPCLSYVTSLSHHRASENGHVYVPAQNQYPIWNFFYGTLADREVLSEKLDLHTPPDLRPAIVQGSMQIWAGTYKALVDGDDTVTGWAYEVVSAEHEDVLRHYETEQYETVRCRIFMQDIDECIMGLTFRFSGDCG
ncbi:gamma-glutamylcyclotransferase family protein [Aspergillus stella-maris]|uniref:gamma-glutamylcyclotransferase family protein n=1 Tax=Aspergillus stella-maris TaxID=1810926 RepID=UPI003CCC9059